MKKKSYTFFWFTTIYYEGHTLVQLHYNDEKTQYGKYFTLESGPYSSWEGMGHEIRWGERGRKKSQHKMKPGDDRKIFSLSKTISFFPRYTQLSKKWDRNLAFLKFKSQRFMPKSGNRFPLFLLAKPFLEVHPEDYAYETSQEKDEGNA